MKLKAVAPMIKVPSRSSTPVQYITRPECVKETKGRIYNGWGYLVGSVYYESYGLGCGFWRSYQKWLALVVL